MNTLRLGLIMFAVLGSFACGAVDGVSYQDSVYSAPVVVGKIETPDVKESSGLTASECQDVLWTHNDAGNGPVIFAMDTQGKHLGAWKVATAENVDWESISSVRDTSGKCSLLIGDIGDNDEKRSELTIYRIPEPSASAETASSNLKQPIETAQPEILKFAYANGAQNAEVLIAHPTSGDLYLLTKEKRGPASIYRLKATFASGRTERADKIGEIAVPASPEGLLSGGSISPDGTRIMLCDVKNGYELVLPQGETDPGAIWRQKPIVVDLGERKQGEAVSYARDGLSLYASSEKKNTPLIQIRRK